MLILNRYRSQSFLILLAGIYATCLLIVHSTQFLPNADALAFGITADLTILIPVLYYFFIVRSGKAAPVTLVPVFLFSLYFASLILPEAHHQYLNYAELLIFPLELFAISYIIWKVNKTVKQFRKTASVSADFYETLLTTLKKMTGANRAAAVMASEISAFYYAFFAWRQKPMIPQEHRMFSYHRECGWLAVLVIVCIMIVVETFAIHLLVQQWSDIAAWIFTALSIYSIFWLIGDYNAMRLRPILLSEDTLHIRIGLRWSLSIPRSEIANLETVKEMPPKAKDLLNAVIFGEPQLLMTLKSPITAKGLFGLEKRVLRIALAVDGRSEFLTEVRERL